jgi:5-methylcytosine-specific restriction protein A
MAEKMNRGVADRPAWHRWYDLAIWETIKKHFRATQPERAIRCQAQDAQTGQQCNRPATDIDHVKPHKGDWHLFCGGINYENLQGLCHQHHSEKTASELARKSPVERKVIAYCSGVPIYDR